MSKQPTKQHVHSTDQRWLEGLRDDVEKYRGLRTTLYPGQLTIHLIDSDKYWKKRAKKKKKDEQYGDYQY